MQETTGVITMKGNPLTLLGSLPDEGKPVPDFTLVANDLSERKLSDYKGKVCIIASVPSVDTSVCDREARHFNEKAVSLNQDIRILTVSVDLPFALKRWCGAAGIENVETLSDHRSTAFGKDWGILIKELYLLARAVFVVDRNGILRYKELVKEVADEPDYTTVLEKASELV